MPLKISHSVIDKPDPVSLVIPPTIIIIIIEASKEINQRLKDLLIIRNKPIEGSCGGVMTSEDGVCNICGKTEMNSCSKTDS